MPDHRTLSHGNPLQAEDEPWVHGAVDTVAHTDTQDIHAVCSAPAACTSLLSHGGLILSVLEEPHWCGPRSLSCTLATGAGVVCVCVNEEVLKRESFLCSAFVFVLDLREITLPVLMSVYCGIWLLELVWRPPFPARSAHWVQE